MIRRAAAVVVLILAGTVTLRAEPPCVAPGSEHFRYSWRLRGGLSWIAGLRFPTHGVGELKTTYAKNGSVDTQLKITARKGNGFYLYHSLIDEKNTKTLMTYHGYAWGKKAHHERTMFDYLKRLARTREESTDDGVENRVKPIPDDDLRDVLTGIHYLRQNASSIPAAGMRTDIYSDGKLYPVVFRPAGVDRITYRGTALPARSFVIVAAPHASKKWPGAVKVWLTEDKRRIPLRIEMQQTLATLRLDLDVADGCDIE